MTRQYFGQAGHFIAADRCRFHLHTHVNDYCVSTVGDYHPQHGEREHPTEIGHGRTFETMVFQLDAKGLDVSSFAEIDFEGYTDRDAANDGHEALVRKWEGCTEHEDCRANGELARACASEQPGDGQQENKK